MAYEDHGLAMFHYSKRSFYQGGDRLHNTPVIFIPVPITILFYSSNAKMQPAIRFVLVAVGPIDTATAGGVLLV